MEVAEPVFLAEVGALARGLEVQPLVELEFLGRGGVGKRVGLVVGFDEVLDYGAGLFLSTG